MVTFMMHLMYVDMDDNFLYLIYLFSIIIYLLLIILLIILHYYLLDIIEYCFIIDFVFIVKNQFQKYILKLFKFIDFYLSFIILLPYLIDFYLIFI